MPMGLSNVPATFRSLTNRIFYDRLVVIMFVYMDDLVLFSKDETFHLEHLKIVLSPLKDDKLYLSLKKSDLLNSLI